MMASHSLSVISAAAVGSFLRIRQHPWICRLQHFQDGQSTSVTPQLSYPRPRFSSPSGIHTICRRSNRPTISILPSHHIQIVGKIPPMDSAFCSKVFGSKSFSYRCLTPFRWGIKDQEQRKSDNSWRTSLGYQRWVLAFLLPMSHSRSISLAPAGVLYISGRRVHSRSISGQRLLETLFRTLIISPWEKVYHVSPLNDSRRLFPSPRHRRSE